MFETDLSLGARRFAGAGVALGARRASGIVHVEARTVEGDPDGLHHALHRTILATDAPGQWSVRNALLLFEGLFALRTCVNISGHSSGFWHTGRLAEGATMNHPFWFLNNVWSIGFCG